MMASDNVLVIASDHPRVRVGMIGKLVLLRSDGATVYFDDAISLKDGEATAPAILKLPLRSIALIAIHNRDN